MKQKLHLVVVCVLTIFTILSCDSLWKNEYEKPVIISFKIPQEMVDSYKEEVAVAQSVSNAPRLVSSKVDTSIKAIVTIHNAEDDEVLAEKSLTIGENLNDTISFEPLYIVGETVYARIELTQYGHLTKSSESKRIIVFKGKNKLEFNFGSLDLNITKMIASLSPDGLTLTVSPDPAGTGIKAAILAEVTKVFGSVKTIETVIIKGPSDGSKIIPEANLSKLFGSPGSGQFYSNLTTIDGLDNLYTGYVTNMSEMFYSCSSLVSVNLSSFDTSKVTTMSSMFNECKSLSTINVSSFDTSQVTDMSSMFASCNALTTLDVSSFNTSKVTNMFNMFSNPYISYPGALPYVPSNLKSINFGYNFSTSNVTNMSNMFENCDALENLDLSIFDTPKVTLMNSMFIGCKSLNTLDLSSFNTSNVTFMSSMFSGCQSLNTLDLSSFDTSNVTFMNSMFSGCTTLGILDLSSFDISKVSSSDNMFDGCTSVVTAYARTEADRLILDSSSGKPGNVNFVVK